MRSAVVLGLSIAVASSGLGWARSTSGPPVSAITITRSHHSNFGGPFSLVDQDGSAVSSADFRGTPMLIYSDTRIAPMPARSTHWR